MVAQDKGIGTSVEFSLNGWKPGGKLRGVAVAANRKRRFSREKSEAEAALGYRMSRSMRVLECLRSSEQTTSGVAKYIREPVSIALATLKLMRQRRQIYSETNEEGETSWIIPKRHVKAHVQAQGKLIAAAATFLDAWIRSSIKARQAAGIEVIGSYPYSRVREENDSLTTSLPI